MQVTALQLRSSIALWEKLRLAYNAIMICIGVPIAMNIYHMVQTAPAGNLPGPKSSYDVSSLVLATVLFGFAANLCYFVGPLGDLYYQLLFRRSTPDWVRYSAFVTGLVVSFGVMGLAWMWIGLLVNPFP